MSKPPIGTILNDSDFKNSGIPIGTMLSDDDFLPEAPAPASTTNYDSAAGHDSAAGYDSALANMQRFAQMPPVAVPGPAPAPAPDQPTVFQRVERAQHPIISALKGTLPLTEPPDTAVGRLAAGAQRLGNTVYRDVLGGVLETAGIIDRPLDAIGIRGPLQAQEQWQKELGQAQQEEQAGLGTAPKAALNAAGGFGAFAAQMPVLETLGAGVLGKALQLSPKAAAVLGQAPTWAIGLAAQDGAAKLENEGPAQAATAVANSLLFGNVLKRVGGAAGGMDANGIVVRVQASPAWKQAVAGSTAMVAQAAATAGAQGRLLTGQEVVVAAATGLAPLVTHMTGAMDRAVSPRPGAEQTAPLGAENRANAPEPPVATPEAVSAPGEPQEAAPGGAGVKFSHMSSAQGDFPEFTLDTAGVTGEGAKIQNEGNLRLSKLGVNVIEQPQEPVIPGENADLQRNLYGPLTAPQGGKIHEVVGTADIKPDEMLVLESPLSEDQVQRAGGLVEDGATGQDLVTAVRRRVGNNVDAERRAYQKMGFKALVQDAEETLGQTRKLVIFDPKDARIEGHNYYDEAGNLIRQSETHTAPRFGPGAANTGESAPPKPFVTSLRKSVVAQEREQMHLPPLPDPARRSDAELLADAEKALEDDPSLTSKILAAPPHSLGDTEVAVLLRAKTSAINDANKAHTRYLAAEKSGDVGAMLEAKRQEEYYANEAIKADETIAPFKTETARGLRAFGLAMKEDYSKAALDFRMRKAQGDKPLTEEQEQRNATLSSAIATVTEALQKSEGEAAAARERGGITQAFAEARVKAAREKLKGLQMDARTIEEQRAAILKGLAAATADGHLGPKAATWLQRLALNMVHSGIKDPRVMYKTILRLVEPMLPEHSLEDIRDAISGYGKFRQLSKDEDMVALRDAKGQMQQMAKLQAVHEKRPLLMTGVERRKASDAERRRIDKLNEAKRALGVVVKDPATQLKSAQDAIKTRLDHQIADIEYELASGRKIVVGKTRVTDDAEITAKRARLAELRAIRAQTFGVEGPTPEARLAAALKAAEKMEADSVAQLEAAKRGEFKQPVQGPKLSSERIEALRAKADENRKAVAELKRLANPGATPEERALAARERFLAGRVAEIQDRLARNDYSKRVRSEPPMSPKTAALTKQLSALKTLYEVSRRQAEFSQLGGIEKAVRVGGVGMDVFKALQASYDLSAFGRQGVITLASHPIMAVKALGYATKDGRTEETAIQGQAAIQARPNARNGVYRKMGIDFTSKEHPEDWFVGAAVAGKTPVIGKGVAWSDRQFSANMNRLRADLADNLYRRFVKQGKGVLDSDLKAIGEFVDITTGRGAPGKLAAVMHGLQHTLWSPRLLVSRFQFLTGKPLWSNPRTRRLFAQEYARTIAGFASVYTAASMVPGVTIGKNPFSSDFGKVIIGDVRVDVLGGMAQTLVLMARVAAGKQTNSAGHTYPIRGQVPYGKPNAWEVITNYGRSKLSPAAGTPVDIATGIDLKRGVVSKNVIGQEMGPLDLAQNLVTPLAWQDMKKIFQKEGVTEGTALFLLSALGLGVNYYDKETKGWTGVHLWQDVMGGINAKLTDGPVPTGNGGQDKRS